ncbi:membrane protein [Fluviibacter phosphoraccumulans]|uniref:Membrane protein n=2 Tax=Fluviibacter phosphoraccumulans TaxID=1751046 RepID=A0A679I218_9RHOO|nr:membrane protein [Fluviibacter phosphoraccumulans]BBU72298.1 membrane protein [Fluviibacter phosphoraccumulans]BCA64460.1 membrane protein [Fluviibacter phosphoraccumulans]
MSKGVNPGTTKNEGGSFNMKSNSSLLGFKGTEDLGNGLKGLFQIETNVGLTGQSANQGVAAGSTSNAGWGQLRDSYVGMNSKYGTVLGGFLSTPYRSALTSFDVMPGATGDARIETMMGTQRVSKNGLAYTAQSSVRATALAYALPTMYGFDGSIAYTGSNNNGNNENVNSTGNNLYSALSTQIGWTGYGVNVKGAFQQAKMMGATTAGVSQTPANAYTSYLIGASYTGLPGLKASVVYNRNTLGGNTATLATGATSDANKGSNNQIYAGVSYRFGNNEPRLTYQNSSNTSFNGASANDGATLWGANWGYYLSKRTQVYGIVSTIKNNQNGTVNMASGGTSLVPTGGQVVTTYGAGLRTNF